MTTINFARDGALHSPWQTISKLPTSGDIKNKIYDSVIVGGGITGLTAALLLQKAGKTTLIAEAYSPGFGTTGGTSAHINTFADTSYNEAEGAFGEEGAQRFADAINEGFRLIKTNVD